MINKENINQEKKTEKEESKRETFLIIDGSGLIHSSYHISKKTSNSVDSTIYFFLIYTYENKIN